MGDYHSVINLLQIQLAELKINWSATYAEYSNGYPMQESHHLGNKLISLQSAMTDVITELMELEASTKMLHHRKTLLAEFEECSVRKTAIKERYMAEIAELEQRESEINLELN